MPTPRRHIILLAASQTTALDLLHRILSFSYAHDADLHTLHHHSTVLTTLHTKTDSTLFSVCNDLNDHISRASLQRELHLLLQTHSIPIKLFYIYDLSPATIDPAHHRITIHSIRHTLQHLSALPSVPVIFHGCPHPHLSHCHPHHTDHANLAATLGNAVFHCLPIAPSTDTLPALVNFLHATPDVHPTRESSIPCRPPLSLDNPMVHPLHPKPHSHCMSTQTVDVASCKGCPMPRSSRDCICLNVEVAPA